MVGEFSCPDVEEGRPMAAARLLQAFADTDAAADPDAFDPELLAFLSSLRAQERAAAALQYIQEHVAFREEAGEQFVSPSATLRLGYGDCDDSARALLSLARTLGVRGRLVFFLQDAQPAHVTAQLWDGRAWRWAEATIAARFGEHPFAAYQRIGGSRPDLDGRAVLLTDDRTLGRIGAMSETQVQRTATPVTAQDVLNALAEAWPQVMATDPGSALQILVAQSAFETGAWAAVWNWNLGNVKYSPGAGTDWFTMTATEGSGAGTTMVASKWRSYPSLAQGAAAWLGVLSRGYSSALSYAVAGDVDGFVQALKDGGYFTGDESQYDAGVQRYYSQYSGLSPNAIVGQAETAFQTAESAIDQTPTDGVSLASAAGTVVGGFVLGLLVGRFLA